MDHAQRIHDHVQYECTPVSLDTPPHHPAMSILGSLPPQVPLVMVIAPLPPCLSVGFFSEAAHVRP